MTDTVFLVSMLQNARQVRQAANLEVETVLLSERDSLRALEALVDPSAPNARLLAAAYALPVAVSQLPFSKGAPAISNPS